MCARSRGEGENAFLTASYIGLELSWSIAIRQLQLLLSLSCKLSQWRELRLWPVWSVICRPVCLQRVQGTAVQNQEPAMGVRNPRWELLKPALTAELDWGTTPSVSKEKAIYANLLRIPKGVERGFIIHSNWSECWLTSKGAVGISTGAVCQAFRWHISSGCRGYFLVPFQVFLYGWRELMDKILSLSILWLMGLWFPAICSSDVWLCRRCVTVFSAQPVWHSITSPWLAVLVNMLHLVLTGTSA